MTITVTADGRGTISIGTGTIGTRVIDKDYPYIEGLSGATTKQVGNPNLEEQKW